MVQEMLVKEQAQQKTKANGENKILCEMFAT